MRKEEILANFQESLKNVTLINIDPDHEVAGIAFAEEWAATMLGWMEKYGWLDEVDTHSLMALSIGKTGQSMELSWKTVRYRRGSAVRKTLGCWSVNFVTGMVCNFKNFHDEIPIVGNTLSGVPDFKKHISEVIFEYRFGYPHPGSNTSEENP